jgi:hypothetical protein
MKQTSKLMLIILWNIFIAFNFASAQTAAPSDGTINRNQPPNYSPTITPYPQTSPIINQTPSPTQSPRQNIKPPSKITPAPTPSPTKELPPQAKNQLATPETSAQTSSQNTANTSGSPSYLFYVILPMIIILAAFWKKITELIKNGSKSGLPAEDDGTVCQICGGAGKVTKKRKRSEPCSHCKGTGNDICHNCGGTGKYSTGFTVPQSQEEIDSLLECPYCEGKGFPQIRNVCEFCKGKGKIEFEESYEDTCLKCKGSGRIVK